ncbi:MAG: CRISPR-associated protein Cas4 [Cetobacterium sp.]
MKKREGIELSKEILEIGFQQILKYAQSEFVTRKFTDVEKNLFVLRKDYTIEGTIDLILEENDNLKVIDFKTGTDDLSNENLENYISQIKLYCYLLSMNSSKNVIGGEIYFIKNDKKILVDYNSGVEEEILKSFDELSQKICNGSFSEKSSSKEKCMKCEFKKHCFGINMI